MATMTPTAIFRCTCSAASNCDGPKVRAVDGILRDDFANWYDGFPASTATFEKAAWPHQIERTRRLSHSKREDP